MFSIQQIAEAGGYPATTIRSWFHRGHFEPWPDADLPPERAGFGLRISLRTAVAIMIAMELAELGVPPAVASQAGMKFAHTGKVAHPLRLERTPGQPFPDGPTLIVIARNGDIEISNRWPEPRHACNGGSRILEVSTLVHDFIKKIVRRSVRHG